MQWPHERCHVRREKIRDVLLLGHRHKLLPIAEHWMYHFFCVHVFIENKANENAIAIIKKLANGNAAAAEEEYDNEGELTQGEPDDAAPAGFFVQSAYLQAQLAIAYYDARNYDSAHEHFLALSEREP
jgi:hypothetical protein